MNSITPIRTTTMHHTVETRLVTPAWAADIIGNDMFSRQRAKSKSHVAFLAETMARGEFDGGSPLRFGLLSGSQFLLDGQHRLLAVMAHSEPVEFVVVTTRCVDADDLARLYARIDRGRGRSIADALRALGTFENSPISTTDMQRVMACAPLFSVNLSGRAVAGSAYDSKSAEARATTMAPWMHAAAKFFNAVAGVPQDIGRMLHRREILSCGIATFADAPPALAHDFWAGIAADDGLAKHDPRKQALEFFRRTKATNNSALGPLAHGAAACWNAWARGDTLKVVKVMDVTAPLRLAHTRFTGRQS